MPSPQKTASVLIVEDDTLLAQLIARQLETLGYSVAGILAKGEEAIAQTAQLKPDLVLMDIMLAGSMDGIEAARQIQLVAQVPVVFLTAYAERELVDRALSTGPFAYLQKPLKQRELELTVELALLRHRKEEQERSTHHRLERRAAKNHQALVSTSLTLEEMKAERQRNLSSLRRFSDAMDVSADSIFLIDRASMRFIDVNSTACERSGYSKSELLEMGPQDIKPYFTRQMLEHEFDRIAASQDRFGIIDTFHQCKNQEIFPVEVRLRAMKAEGRTTIVAIARDMTLRYRTEQALRLSEEKFRLLFEYSPIGLALISKDLRLTDANPSFCNMLGYSQAELTGKKIDEITHPDDRSSSLKQAAAIFDGEIQQSNFINEKRYLRKNGDAIWCRLHGAVISDHNRNPMFGLGMIENIDQIKQTENLRMAQEAAQKKALVREIHHRIKNHLQGVVGLMQQHAQDNKQCGSSIAAAIEQINVVATIHGLQGNEASEAIDLLQMLTAINQGLRAINPAGLSNPIKTTGNMSFFVNPEESVPIALALNELIVNAGKHGTGAVEISLDSRAEQAVIRIENQCLNTITTLNRGSGLKLVHALLQTGGVAFHYEFGSQNFMAEIKLSPPVIQLRCHTD